MVFYHRLQDGGLLLSSSNFFEILSYLSKHVLKINDMEGSSLIVVQI